MSVKLRRWLRGFWFDWSNRNQPRDYCCCGDSMENHADPMYCGHSPTNAWDYYKDKYVREGEK